MIVKIEKIVTGGDGMGRVDGKVVFVPLTVPGEVHRLEIREEKKAFIRADSVELIESDYTDYHRIDPFCPLYGQCGGCNLQHIPYEEQLKIKKELVMDNYHRLGGLDEDFDPVIHPSPEKSYRNRVQLHHDGEILGFRERRSNRIIPIENCPLLADGLNKFLQEFTGQEKKDITSERFTLFGTQEQYWMEGRDTRIDLIIEDHGISFSPELFFQSNLSLVPRLIKDVCDFAGKGDSFLDLYSGVGLFSLFLEDNFTRGTAVESARGASRFGRMNLKKTEYFEQKVEIWARKSKGKGKNLDFAVVDPPRTGLSKSAIDTLAYLKPSRLAYVSCNPATQARDLKLLLQRGFELQEIGLYDFYPQTAHLESLATLIYKG